MPRIASTLLLALVAGIFSTTAFGQQATSFGTGQQEANILGRLMGEQAGLKAELDALQARVRRLGTSAAPTDLTPLTTRMTEIERRLGEIETELDGKADQADLDALSGRVDGLGHAPASAAAATQTVSYTSDLHVIAGLDIVGRFGDPAMDQLTVGGVIDIYTRFLWPLSGGSKMAAGVEVNASPIGSGGGVSVAGLPSLQFGDVVGLGAGPVYYCDGLWSGPSGCSAARAGGMVQVTAEKPIAPFGLRAKAGVELLQTDLANGGAGQELRGFAGLGGFFGSSGSQD